MATLVAPNQKSPVEDVEALHKAFKGIIYHVDKKHVLQIKLSFFFLSL